MMTDGGYLTYAEASDYLQLSTRTLRRAVAANRIPYTRDPLTGRPRFKVAALDKWMDTRGKVTRA